MENNKENKMGSMPITKLIFTMSLPAILSMMVQAAYNIVDSMFVSWIGKEALTALSLAFPIQIILIACFLGVGVGINALVSRKIGENDIEMATNIAEHGLLVSGILYLIVAIGGFLLVPSFFKVFTDNQLIIKYGISYTRIILVFSFGRIFAQAGMSTLQGTGDMVKPMRAQLIGAFSNIILDPILIFGAFGIKGLGVSGAAIATVIAQVLSMIYILFVIFKGNNLLKLNLKNFKFKGQIVKQIIVIGVPVAIMQGLGFIMITGLNFILKGFSESAVAVLGVYYKVQSFVFMPVFGLSQGTMPIIGYNYGARNKERIISALKISTLAALVYMTIGMIVFKIFPEELLYVFKSTPQMLEIGVVAFKVMSYGFPLAAISIMIGTAFQGMGKAYISMIVSFVRQIVVLLPSAYLLGKIWGLDALWYSFLVSEFIGLLVVILCFIKLYRSSLLKWK